MYSANLVLFGVLPVRIYMLSLGRVFISAWVSGVVCSTLIGNCKSLSVWNGQPMVPRLNYLLFCIVLIISVVL